MKKRLCPAWLWFIGLWLVIGAVGLFVGFGYALAAAVAAATLAAVSLLGMLGVRRHMEVALVFPSFALKKRAIGGTVQVKNSAWLPASRVFCEIAARNELTGAEQTQLIALSITAHSEEQERLSLRGEHCGAVVVRVERAWVTDMLGLIALRVPVQTHTRVTVLPDSFAAQTYMQQRLLADADSDLYRTDRPGADVSEPFQLRPYRRGDDVRRIHWKLSSKLDEPVVRDGSEPVVRSLLLFWDKTASAPDGTAMDTVAEAVVSVARALAESGVSCTLGWTEGGTMVLEQIDSVESLLECVPAMLRTGCAPADVQLPMNAMHGCVLHFAAAEPAVVLPQEQLLLYSRTPRAGALCFDENNYRDVLQRLDIEP